MTPRTWRAITAATVIGVALAAMVAPSQSAALGLLPATEPVAADDGAGSVAAASNAGHPAPAFDRLRPSLPPAAGWPFGDAFPSVAGTGGMANGAVYWTDFLYDDRGARGAPVGSSVTPFAQSRGTYEYDDPDAARNGADIFRAAVGVDADASYWRIDWNTLLDPVLPIAAWVLDTDSDQATGAGEWPANARVRSPGGDLAIVVSARHAALVDVATGRDVAVLVVAVDEAARSFVVRVPRTVLPVSGVWRVRLGAGVADAEGRGFKTVTEAQGALPNGASLYNVAFRHRDQEPPLTGEPRSPSTMSPWMESAQAAALSAGDVSAFKLDVEWAALEQGMLAPPSVQRGWLNRWYVSSIELGQGVVRDAQSPMDLRPNYLGRVQPYAVYVPSSYEPGTPAPLTILLHSAFQAHNAFASVTPRFVEQACEARRSICLSPLGRGHDGWWLDEAELDFWEAWSDLADSYAIDPDRTVIAGFSLGGYGVYRLTMEHPDLFAKAVVIAASPICGARFAPGVERPAGPGRCTTDSDTTPMVPAARWVPFYISHGTTDELLPFTGAVDQVAAFDRLGLRHRFDHYLGQPHIPWYLQDGWGEAAEAMGSRVRTTRPGAVTLAWHPNAARPDLGTGVTGAYWVDDVEAREVVPGGVARIDAKSNGQPDAAVQLDRSVALVTREDATPAVSTELAWLVGSAPARHPSITADLHNVGRVAFDLVAAGMAQGEHVSIEVTTDGLTAVTLTGVAGSVWVDGVQVGAMTASRPITLAVDSGTHLLEVRP